MSTFTQRLKHALTGSTETPLVFLGNIEVEEQWARGEPGLPTISSAAAKAVTHRMDELALLLGGEPDSVALKAEPDPGYAAYLAEYGLSLPKLLAVAAQQPGRTVTLDLLEDPVCRARLSELGAAGAYLAPHGMSEWEQRLAEECGLGLATSPAELSKRVNSKIFSRRLADRLGLRQPDGLCCETPEDLGGAVDFVADQLAAGRKAVVKDAFGVSGKGVMVVDDERRLAWLRRTAQRARRRGEGLRLVVEEWIGKRADLNYQVTIARDGSVSFDFDKEAITEGGVHKGHRMPPRLTPGQTEEIRTAGLKIGAALAEEGYQGVAGMDALIATDETVYPMIEINARFNMSTYQAALHEAFVGEGCAAQARQYPMRLHAPLPFNVLRRELADLLLDAPGETGAVINNFATLNAAAEQAEGKEHFDGRLYAFLVGPDTESVAALDERLSRRLEVIAKGELSHS
jgi:D-alanine-D-alanine ligase-like ATP-grasp enzyme